MVNFKINITADRISVLHAEGGWPPDVGSTIVFFGLSAVTVCVVATWLVTVDSWFSPSNLPLLVAIILFAGTLLWAALRGLFPSGQSLSCDRSTLTIGRIPGGSLRGRWDYESFPVTEVKELQFASVEFGGRMEVLGLRFKIDRKTKKILAGLESPEAAKILDALASLGINVIRDPAMPMMVDIAISQRKNLEASSSRVTT